MPAIELDKLDMRVIVLLTSLSLVISCDKSHNTFKIDFDSFDNNTQLTVKSYIHDKSDCGEFGGHEETILVKKKNGELTYYYKRDSTACPREFAIRYKKEVDRPIALTGLLSDQKQLLLQEYLDVFFTHQPSWNQISNAIDSYEVELVTEFRTITFKLSPVENKWNHYKVMREQFVK